MFNEQVTPELRAAMRKFEEAIPDSCVPLEMIPSSETTAGLLYNIQKSIEAGKDLLPEIYDWKLDGMTNY